MATIVKIGSARIDEHGNVSGGTSGDKTGKEVSTQDWYRHSKGWVVIRAKDPTVRSKIAKAMQNACNNPNIGYDQRQRDTLYNAAKPFGFDPGKVTTKCETDCSALVRVCCLYAGVDVGNFRTVTEPGVLKATGDFDILNDVKYTARPDYLMKGDILCTPVSGHTVVVLNDGDLAHGGVAIAPFVLTNVPTLKYGDKGEAVAYMQYLLARQGYKLPGSVKLGTRYGYDGVWKTLFKSKCETEKVFRKWQSEHDDLSGHPLKVDGVCGPKSWSALLGVACK